MLSDIASTNRARLVEIAQLPQVLFFPDFRPQISVPMDIYENIVIGNFLYSLGLLVGAHESGRTPACVNLLQQTPLDRTLGDVLLATSGAMRLLEFKRRENKSEKEAAKLRMLSRALEADKTRQMRAVSHKVHWYVETSVDKKDFVSRVVRYLEHKSQGAEQFSIAAFTASLAEAAVSSSSTDEELELSRRYLALVAATNGSFSGSSGALLVHYHPTEGLRYVVVETARDLLLSHKRVVDYHLNENRLNIEKERERAENSARKQLGLEVSRGRGYAR
ncbi:hypothetical protein [Caballeronia sp. 15711]|uniref:hypothetical protein n=1 Tax=Caballeronia sp. 15711 TaxID=3391029 RepID=UPI0039E7201A